MPTAAPAEPDERDLEWFVRFLRPEKALPVHDLPGGGLRDDVIARVFGITHRAYREMVSRFREVVDAAATGILEDPVAHARAGRLAERNGAIVALGDSNTDDRQSWAEILDRVLALARPGTAARLVNRGVSGSTSADVLGRIGDVHDLQPSLAIVMAGTNDARRQGPAGAAMAVSHAETERNLRLIARHVHDATGVAPVWITPPPVLERRVRAHPYMARWRVAYRTADVAAKAAIVRTMGGRVVDVHAALGRDETGDKLLEDGVHLALAGQIAVTRLLLDRLDG
jgi:lysophospholipase L1-like esterase